MGVEPNVILGITTKHILLLVHELSNQSLLLVALEEK